MWPHIMTCGYHLMLPGSIDDLPVSQTQNHLEVGRKIVACDHTLRLQGYSLMLLGSTGKLSVDVKSWY
jgi:hypothetical protein